MDAETGENFDDEWVALLSGISKAFTLAFAKCIVQVINTTAKDIKPCDILLAKTMLKKANQMGKRAAPSNAMPCPHALCLLPCAPDRYPPALCLLPCSPDTAILARRARS